MQKLKGVLPVLVSPVNQDGTIDQQGYHNLLDHTMQSPICGYWILGSASEDFMISYDDRVRITRIVAEHVDGRLPVIVGCAQPAVSEIYRFMDDTADLKIAAYHLLPQDKRMSVALTCRYLEMIADRSPKPLWLYNNGMRAQQIPVPAVRQTSAHPNVVGIKAAGFDLMDILPFCRMHCDDFQVIGSGGGHMLLFLAMGCDAHTVSSACTLPKVYCRMYDLWQQGRLDQARALDRKLSQLSKAMPRPDNTELSGLEKGVLEIFGICRRHVYPPFFECTDAEISQARQALQNAGWL